MGARTSSWRDAALREMGLGPIWRLRARESAGPAFAEAEAAAPSGYPDAPDRTPAASPPAAVESRLRAPAPQAMANRPAHPSAPSAVPASGSSGMPATKTVAAQVVAGQGERAARIATLDWEALESDIRSCRACGLCERRRQAVPGVGDRHAGWMLVGEGPGAEEDQRGEPFVGQAGRLLDNMLSALGLERDKDVYIANAVKCRPPHNRTPERDELAACLPYLDRQIELVRPQLLIALGRPAAQALLDREVAISAARGKRFERQGIPVVVTYHPAYLLRNPQDKAKAWEDLCFARRLMAELAR